MLTHITEKLELFTVFLYLFQYEQQEASMKTSQLDNKNSIEVFKQNMSPNQMTVLFQDNFFAWNLN